MTSPHDGRIGVRVESLRHRHGRDTVLALDGWALPEGARCIVHGPSGSGKTTLIHCLAGLTAPSEGRVQVGNTEISALAPAARDRFRARNIGLVPQRLHLIAAITVADNLRLARRLAGLPADEAGLQALLVELDLGPLAARRPETLSHGQAQRAAIARALVNRPALLLADEPTAALDDANALAAAALLRRSADAYQATLVVASHDARIVDGFDSRLALDRATAIEAAP